MPKQFLKPAVEGAKVPKEKLGEFLKPEGEEIEINVYWHRRLDHGDVIAVPQPDAPAAAKKSKA